MEKAKLYSSWQDIVEYGTDGPAHTELIKTDSYKAVLVGLEAGQKIPPHPALAASYHFLEGSGRMVVDGEQIPFERGSTVVVPEGVSRGVEADTRTALLASHAAGASSPAPKMPIRRMAVMGLVSVGAMAVLMVVFGRMFGSWSPMLSLMFQGGDGVGLGLWGMMIIPAVALIVMFTMMFFFYRAMSRGAKSMNHSMNHSAHHTKMGENAESITLAIPAISCDHCKATIESEIGGLSGVASVRVDVDAREAEIRYGLPATVATIEEKLVAVGYPPSKP